MWLELISGIHVMVVDFVSALFDGEKHIYDRLFVWCVDFSL